MLTQRTLRGEAGFGGHKFGLEYVQVDLDSGMFVGVRGENSAQKVGSGMKQSERNWSIRTEIEDGGSVDSGASLGFQ